MLHPILFGISCFVSLYFLYNDLKKATKNEIGQLKDLFKKED